MRSVICYPSPLDIEGAKAKNPTLPIYGSSVYLNAVIQTFVRYGTYDRYYLRRSQPMDHSGDFEAGRIRFYSNPATLEFCDADDVVLFAGVPGMFIMTPWRTLLGRPTAPIVGTIHSMHDQTFPLVLWRLLMGGDIRGHDALICSTHSGKRVVENILRDIGEQAETEWKVPVSVRLRLPVIPLGVDAAEFRKFQKDEARRSLEQPQDAFIFLYLGRFSTAMKCDLVPLVLLFCRKIAPAFPKAVLILAGDDTATAMAQSLRTLAGRLGCPDRVQVLPDVSRERKLKLYAAGDVFISPSDSIQETFGLTLVEAMCAGMPVIASDWDGYKEIVDHGHTGFLVPTYLTPPDESMERIHAAMLSSNSASIAAETVIDLAAMEQHMRTLLMSPDLRERMGQKAMQTAQLLYDWKVVVRQYEELWDELLTEARSTVLQSRAPGQHLGIKSIFGHYPTGFLTGYSVRLAEPDPALEAQMVALLTEDSRSFARDLSISVLTELRRCTCLPIEELCSRVALQDNRYGGLARDRAWAHVARLLKYGLLELA